MVHVLLPVLIIAVGWSTTLAESVENPSADLNSRTSLAREPRSIRKKLCSKFGLCGNGGGYGHQSYGGYENYQGGYGGYQGGHGNPGYVPINIAISQSQSSANEGGGGYGSGYYPNNHQYNGGYPYQGYQNGYNRYPNQGYGGYRPGFDNGNLAHNNQFNGNYYSGYPNGGYQGFQGYRAGEDGYDYDDYEKSSGGSGAVARSTAVASSKS